MRREELPPDRRAALDQALEPGETLRWLSGSDLSRSASGEGRNTAGFVWLGLVAPWEIMALVAAFFAGDPRIWIYPAVGALFLGIGGLLLLRARAERRVAARRLYAITDRRLLTLTGEARQAIDGARIVYAEPRPTRSGFGDIEIGSVRGEAHAAIVARDADAFHHLRGVAKVNDAVKALRRLVADRGRSLTTEAPDD